MKSITLTLPTHWADYLTTGDADSLLNSTLAQVDVFLARKGLPLPPLSRCSAVLDTRRFSHLANDEVQDYVFAPKPEPDFSVYNGGSVFLFTPLTAAAQAWLDEHCPAGGEHSYMGRSLAVDHRYAEGLWILAVDAGLTLSGRAAR
jgi:hypothetical protein